jgi:hypothetical protein
MPNNADNEKNRAIRNLKEIFEQMTKIKDADLEEPTDDKSLEATRWYEEFVVETYENITKSNNKDQKTKKQIVYNSIPDYYAYKNREGMMFNFIYQPESENLDYWDRFPLVMRMLDNSDSTKSMLGINFHYLEPKYRRILLLNLMTKIVGDISNPDSKIFGLNMSRLALPGNRYGRVCIRRYKYDNIVGKVLRIPPEHWIKMIYLPTYQFVGARPNKVWRDSYKKIRRLNLRYGDTDV